MKSSIQSVSLVVCSRNRVRQLEEMLARFVATDAAKHGVELVLVDSASTDGTAELLQRFKRSAVVPVVTVSLDQPGLGRARNAGIRAATGDLICFTDDDCYLAPTYFSQLLGAVDPSRCQYGTGTILLFDPTDDMRVANQRIEKKRLLSARTLLAAGTIQGANMFFLRSVFDKAGQFDERMGAGTEFPCEDIEMATRASLAGFVGIQLPEPVVYHHHQRKAGSPEANETVSQYDFGRGAYYASLMVRQVPGVWEFWSDCGGLMRAQTTEQLARVQREMQGAARLLAAFNK